MPIWCPFTQEKTKLDVTQGLARGHMVVTSPGWIRAHDSPAHNPYSSYNIVTSGTVLGMSGNKSRGAHLGVEVGAWLPQGTFGDIWRHLVLSEFVGGGAG